jgi:hypothetical protein
LRLAGAVRTAAPPLTRPSAVSRAQTTTTSAMVPLPICTRVRRQADPIEEELRVLSPPVRTYDVRVAKGFGCQCLLDAGSPLQLGEQQLREPVSEGKKHLVDVVPVKVRVVDRCSSATFRSFFVAFPTCLIHSSGL